jgi:hypothetical protein
MTMNKAKTQDPDISAEYTFARGNRGAYAEQAKKGMRYVIVSDADDRERKDRVGKAQKKA